MSHSLLPSAGAIEDDPTGRIQSIDRTVVILHELASTPHGLTALQLLRRTSIEWFTVLRILTTLIHRYMISTGHGMYYLGPDVPGVCHRARQPANVRRSALPYAPELQEKILEGRAALVSISMPARDEIIEIGNSFPIDTAASGLAILSTYFESECV